MIVRLVARLAYLVVALLTLGLACLALLCWGSVLSGTAAANSDGGCAIVLTFLAGFLGVMLWIDWTR